MVPYVGLKAISRQENEIYMAREPPINNSLKGENTGETSYWKNGKHTKFCNESDTGMIFFCPEMTSTRTNSPKHK